MKKKDERQSDETTAARAEAPGGADEAVRDFADENPSDTDAASVDEKPSPARVYAPEEIAELETRAGERDKFLDLAQRVQAEYLNYQKRCRREREDMIKYGAFDFALGLINVIDHFDAALVSVEQGHDPASVLTGLKMIRQEFRKFLEDEGIREIDPVGSRFDPEFHHGVAVEPTDLDEKDNEIAACVKKGYLYRDRVMRPASVTVLRKDQPAAPSPESAAGTDEAAVGSERDEPGAGDNDQE